MQPLTPGRRRAALIALALGGFGLGLTEFVAVGLLPELARELLPGLYARSTARALSEAGWVITAYGLGVVVGAPTIAILSATVPKRRLVLGLLSISLIGNLTCAVAPTLSVVLLGRFVAGLAHGAYFGAAGLIAATLLDSGSRAKGFAVVLSGLTAANVVGIPMVTWLGQVAGWRTACGAIAGVFGLTMLAVLLAVPVLATGADESVRAELGALRSRQVWIAAAAGAIGFAGFFSVNSYIAPVTTHVTGLSSATVPWVLAAVGLGMTTGNAVGAPVADRYPRGAVLGGFAALASATALFGAVTGTPVGLFLAAFLVGATCLFLAPALQGWLISAAPQAQQMGAALNQSATNTANSVGAVVGGAAIGSGWGYLAPAWAGTVFGAIGFTLAALTFRPRRRGAITLAEPRAVVGSGAPPGITGG